MIFYVLLLNLVHSNSIEEFHNARILKDKARAMFDHAFDSYAQYGFPMDEVKPISCKPRIRANPNMNNADYKEFILGNFSLTLVDSLDSLVVFNRTQDFIYYSNYLIENLNFDSNLYVSVFESNIRILGGLLSAHVLAKDLDLIPGYQDGLLHKAEEIAKKLSKAFITNTGLPTPYVNLQETNQSPTHTQQISTAEVGSLSLEFMLLSYLTGDNTYANLVMKAMNVLTSKLTSDHLAGTMINLNTLQWTQYTSTIGPNQDSFHEYLLKVYEAFGYKESYSLFHRCYQALVAHALNDGWFIDINTVNKNPTSTLVSGLAAFWPGLEVSIGHILPAAELHAQYYALWAFYEAMPDQFNLLDKKLMAQGSSYPLRPELIESNYYLYTATHNKLYLEIAEKIMNDINKRCKVKCGFATLEDVSKKKKFKDEMESFFLSETMKYLYLTFAEAEKYYASDASRLANLLSQSILPQSIEPVNPHKYVFTTEGHFVPLVRLTNYNYTLGFGEEEAMCDKPNLEKIEEFIKAKLQPIIQDHGKHNKANAVSSVNIPEIFKQPKVTSGSKSGFVLAQVFDSKNTLLGKFEAKHGDLGRKLGKSFEAEVTLAQPQNACSYRRASAYRGKIVLAKRGDCSFSDKQANLADTGVLAVLIYDNVPQKNILHMQKSTRTDKHSDQIVLMVMMEDGEKLKELIENSWKKRPEEMITVKLSNI